MTAHLFFVAPGVLHRSMTPGAPVVLGGDEGRHAATVKRIGPGEVVLLADGEGLIAEAEVVAAAQNELNTQIRSVREETRPEPHFVLVQALAKADRDLQALEAATELGVDEVLPWQAERSIVQWRGERAAKAKRKWVAQAEAATKQSRQAISPVIGDLVDKNRLSARVQDATLALVLHEDATTPLSAVELPTAGNVLLIVGPEGGITPSELDTFTTAGALPVRMGRTVLRSSSAGPAALAALLARSRWS